MPGKKVLTNSADPYHTASVEAVCSGSYLFAIWTRILSIPALITNILVENRKRKLLEILEHLPYFDDE